MRLHRTAWLLSGLVVTAGLVTVALHAAQSRKGGPSPEELLPADAVFYVRWAGIEPHRAAYQKTALRDVLEETSLGKFIGQIIEQISRASGLEQSGPATTMLEQIWRHGVTASLSFGPGPNSEPNLVAVFPGAAASGKLDKALRALVPGGVQELKQDGRTLVMSAKPEPDQVAWWAEGPHVVFMLGKTDAASAVAVATGRQPNLTSSALYRRQQASAKGAEPILQLAGDLDRALALLVESKVVEAATLEQLGLNGIKGLSYSVAFQGRALRSELRLDAPAPRRGIPQLLLDQPKVSMSDLPSLPQDTDGFFLVGLDYARTFDAVVAMLKTIPGGPTEADIVQGLGEVDQALGMRLREELLATLGNKLLIFSAPVQGLPAVGTVLGIEVKDPAKARQAVARIADLIEQSSMGELQVIRQTVGDVELRLFQLPPAVGVPLLPTVAVTDHWAVIGLVPTVVQSFVRCQSGELPGWKPPSDFAQSRGTIPTEGRCIGWNDPRPMVQVLLEIAPTLLQGAAAAAPEFRLDPALIPQADQVNKYLFPGHTAAVVDEQGMRWVGTSSMPMLSVGSPDSITVAAVGTALLLPAVQMAREAARRTQDRNNLRQLGLALHNYHGAHDQFPTGTVDAPQLKPEKRLSWMASILPFVEEVGVYEKLDFKKAWDDEANDGTRSVLAVFLNPQLTETRDANNRGLTHYAGMAGVGADAFTLPNDHPRAGIFGYNRVVSIRDITDGTVHTIMVVDVNEKLGPWAAGGTPTLRALTKEPYINGPDGIGGNFAGKGANVLFADGSVRFISENVDPEVMRALSTKAGGENVNLNFQPALRADGRVGRASR